MKELETKTRTRESRDEITSDSDWIGATIIEEKPGAASRAVVFLLCATPIFAVLGFGAVDPGIQGILVILISLIGFLWLADAWNLGELRFSRNLLQLPVIGLIFIGLIQLLPLRNLSEVNQILQFPAVSTLTLDALGTRQFLVLLAILLVYFSAALTFINNQKRLRAVTATLVVFGLAIAAFSIIQGFSGENKIYWIREAFQANPFGVYINRHHFAALMTMLIGLTLGILYAQSGERELRALQVFAVVIMGVSLILSGSRGAVLSLLSVFAFLLLANALRRKQADEDSDVGEKRSLRRSLALAGGGILVLIVALFVGVLVIGGDAALLRILGFSIPEGDISSGRLHFWETSLQIIRDNPISGIGYNAFGVAFPRYDTWNGVFRVEQAHNDYLQILIEGGVLGLICVLAFLAVLYWQGFRVVNSTHDGFRRGVALGSLAGITGIVIHSFFDFPLRTPANAFVFLMLTALATASISYPKLHRRRRAKQR